MDPALERSTHAIAMYLSKKFLIGIHLPLLLIAVFSLPQQTFAQGEGFIPEITPGLPACMGNIASRINTCKPSDLTPDCLAGALVGDFSKCNNADDQIILGALDSSGNLGSGPDSLPSPEARQIGEAFGKTRPASCGVFNWTFTNCIWIPLLGWLGSWWLTIGGALLRLTGMLFDLLVLHVIVQFKNTLDVLQITGAINTGWTIFRDVANILIIGIFVFIAISIILGLKEFGQKKMVATVIVIAILINFSLLFTQMIIDISNFTALQFYNATVRANSNHLIAGRGDQVDIAAAFLAPMGITSVWDDTRAITDLVAKEAQGGGSTGVAAGLQAFAFGFIGGVMLIVIAAVFLYGSFLIASRAVLLIILMLTSSVAFASHLIPKLSNGEYGWSTWWKSLLNVSIFAPLLMVFLFISLTIVKAAGSVGTASGTLGGIAGANAQTAFTNNLWQTMMIYILATGLLFASLKISSKFANSISGMGIFGGIMKLAAAPVTLGSKFIAAPALKYTVGRMAAARSSTLAGRAKGLNNEAGIAQQSVDSALSKANLAADAQRKAREKKIAALRAERAANTDGRRGEATKQREIARAAEKTEAEEKAAEAAHRADVEKNKIIAADRKREAYEKAPSLIRSSTRYSSVAGSKMNVMNTRPAKALTEAVGLKGILSGQSAKKAVGYSGVVEARAKAAEKIAAKLTPTTQDNDKIRMEAERRFREERANRANQLKATAEGARLQADTQRQAAEAQKDLLLSAQERQEEAQKKYSEAERKRDDEIIKVARDKKDPVTAKPVFEKQHEIIDKDTKRHETAGNEWKDELRKVLASVEPEKRAEMTERIEKSPVSRENLQNLQAEIVAAVADPKLRPTIEQQLRQSNGARESEMRQQEERINDARKIILRETRGDATVENAQAVVNAKTELNMAGTELQDAREKGLNAYQLSQEATRAHSEAEVRADETEAEYLKWEKDTHDRLEEVGKQAVAAVALSAESIAGEIGRQYGTILQRIGGSFTGINEKVGKEVESRYKRSNSRNARLARDLRQLELEENPPPSTSTPTPPPTTPPKTI